MEELTGAGHDHQRVALIFRNSGVANELGADGFGAAPLASAPMAFATISTFFGTVAE